MPRYECASSEIIVEPAWYFLTLSRTTKTITALRWYGIGSRRMGLKRMVNLELNHHHVNITFWSFINFYEINFTLVNYLNLKALHNFHPFILCVASNLSNFNIAVFIAHTQFLFKINDFLAH